MPLDLTIAIPVKNEEENLNRCLEHIGKEFAQKIIVIDSGSTDSTKTIALNFGSEVIDFVWNGKFPKKRNWFLRTHSPKTKWVLFLDADEYLTEAFKTELREILVDSNKSAYWINYKIYFLGKALKGGYPLRKLALMQVGAGEYEQIEETQWSTLDMEIHEHLIINGKIGVIRNKIDHRDLKNIKNYIIKHNEYSSWEASRFMKIINSKNYLHWTWKQRIKYALMQTSLIGPIYFCGTFFLMGGIRDGSRGWAFAILKMSYFNEVYCKIQELKKIENSHVNQALPETLY
jgi:glycosyltransferase involved in cell wall biosynthesis